uniref:Tudor domain-containing protein n=1 Tax=Glossina palpalis gambiensis TaxID=67801 RepID=A0A1B0BHL5_9MUSC
MVLNHIGAEDVVVVYVDYGNVDILSFKQLYETPEDYIRIPFHAIPVILKEVPDCYMTEEIRNFMYSYLNDINVCLKLLQVRRTIEAGDNNQNCTILKENIEEQEKYDVCEITKNIPQSDNVVTITTIAKTNVVFIRSKASDDIKNFLKTVNHLQKLSKTLKTVTKRPRCGEILINKFYDEFCRVMVLNHIGAEDVVVVYVDYGNVDILSFKYLYETPEDYIRIPFHAIPVILKEVPDCYMTEEIRNFMYSYLNVKQHFKSTSQTCSLVEISLVCREKTASSGLLQMAIKCEKYQVLSYNRDTLKMQVVTTYVNA